MTINFHLSGNYETGEVFLNGKLLPLKPSLSLINHSPSGFSWGYAGSGPAQLALAVLYELTKDKEFAIKNHQKFKFQHISTLPQTDFSIEISIDYQKCNSNDINHSL